jgi:hypothetical protein
LGELTGEQSHVVRLLVENFTVIAVGMAIDGTIEAVQHDGLRTFLNRVAKGEIKLGK